MRGYRMTKKILISSKIILYFIILGYLLLVIAQSGCANQQSQDLMTEQNNEYIQTVNEANNINKENSTQPKKANYIDVKYRDTPINIADSRFEYLNTDISSFIRGAWYDWDYQYMVIRLEETYYHYCGLPPAIWEEFKKTESFGRFYNQAIKGNYDCREAYIPDYDN